MDKSVLTTAKPVEYLNFQKASFDYSKIGESVVDCHACLESL